MDILPVWAYYKRYVYLFFYRPISSFLAFHFRIASLFFSMHGYSVLIVQYSTVRNPGWPRCVAVKVVFLKKICLWWPALEAGTRAFRSLIAQSQTYEYSRARSFVHMAAPCERHGPIMNQFPSGWLWEPITCTVLLLSVCEWSRNCRNLVPGFCSCGPSSVLLWQSEIWITVEYQAEAVLLLGRQADLCVSKAGRPT